MEFKGGQTSSAATNGAQPAAPRFAGNGGLGNMHMQKDGGGNGKKIMLAGVIVVAIIVVGLVAWWGWKQMGGASSMVKGNQYQALFLTNGQVYFGKIANVDDTYVKLTDIYYLQVQQTVQPDQNKNNNQNSNNPQVSLAKLGSELHGPEDTMLVNRDQVLFWENLKDDGKVVKAIKENANK